MRNIGLLVKNYFNCGLGMFLGKKKRTKALVGLLIIAILVLGLMVFFGFSAYLMGSAAMMLYPPERSLVFNEMLAMGLATAAILVLILGLQKVTGGQRAKDTEMLLSMPFRKIEIVTAKAMSRYLFNLGLMFVFAFPYAVIYWYFTGFGIDSVLLTLLVIMLVPLFATGICYIVDFLSVVLFQNAAGSNVLKAMFTLVILVGLVLLIYTEDYMSFAPFRWMVDTATGADIMSLLYLLLFTLIPAIIGIYLFSITFSRQNNIAKGKKVEYQKQPSRGTVGAIFNKELNQYLNTPIYMINTIIGPLVIVGVTIWMMMGGADTIGGLLTTLTGQDSASYVVYFVMLAFGFAATMTTASASAISLEGKYLWILKTMPINTRQLLFAKTLLNLMLLIPVIIVCSIILFIVLDITVVQFALLLILPVLISIIIAFGGLFINLLYPKLEWESESAVVKQSMAVIMAMLLGIAISIIPVLLLILFPMSVATVSFIALGIYLMLAIDVVFLTLYFGKKFYERL